MAKVASRLLETDVELDRRYAGWSPGSTSLSGFAAELTFWRKVETEPPGDKLERNWVRASNTPSLQGELLVDLWRKRLNGLGKDWNEGEGRNDLKTLIGESEYVTYQPDVSYHFTCSFDPRRKKVLLVANQITIQRTVLHGWIQTKG
jgi:hypothetical protein